MWHDDMDPHEVRTTSDTTRAFNDQCGDSLHGCSLVLMQIEARATIAKQPTIRKTQRSTLKLHTRVQLMQGILDLAKLRTLFQEAIFCQELPHSATFMQLIFKGSTQSMRRPSRARTFPSASMRAHAVQQSSELPSFSRVSGRTVKTPNKFRQGALSRGKMSRLFLQQISPCSSPGHSSGALGSESSSVRVLVGAATDGANCEGPFDTGSRVGNDFQVGVPAVPQPVPQPWR